MLHMQLLKPPRHRVGKRPAPRAPSDFAVAAEFLRAHLRYLSGSIHFYFQATTDFPLELVDLSDLSKQRTSCVYVLQCFVCAY